MRAILTAVLNEGPASGGRRGIIASYGWVYSGWAATDLPAPFEIELRQVIRDHAVAHEVIERGERLFGEPAASELNLTQATKVLGMGYETGKKLLTANGLVGVAVRRGVLSSMNASKVAEIKTQLSFDLDRKAAAAILGIGKNQFRELISRKIIVTAEDGAAVSADTLRLFMRKLHQRCHGRGDDIGLSEGISLPKACQTMGVPISVAVEAILERRIKPAGFDRDARGMYQVLLTLGSIQHLRSKANNITVKSAARELSVHPEAVSHLLRLGYLKSPCDSKHIDRRALLKFNEQFVPGSWLAKFMKTSSSAIRNYLNGRNVHPVLAPPDCRAIFYLRSQVELVFQLNALEIK